MKIMRYVSVVTALVTMLSGSITLAQGQPPVLVVTDEVKQMEFTDQITLVGRTEASVESRIVSEVYGRIKAINVQEGVPVRAGAALVTVDAERIRYELDSKRALAEQTRLEAELAESQKRRAQELYDQTLISNTALDSAVTWAGILQARYSQLEAEQKMLELDLKKAVISAPFEGFTGRRLVNIGEWVNPGMPVFEMADLSHARVTVDLPEKYFGRLAIGSPVFISQNGGTNQLSGTVTGIAPSAVEETHTFPVIIEVSNTSGSLGGGMLVRATLSLDTKFTGLAVSKDAIVRQGNQTLVYTIHDGKAVPISVATTSTDGQMIAVVAEQLTPGMPVIVRGNERIFPGSPVNTAGGQPSGSASQPETPKQASASN
ncbi:MAG: efflux RND transporter periplasmic adaptor subunit [Candidatus Zixiibacteriota bacterium]